MTKTTGGVDDEKNPTMLKKIWRASQQEKDGYIKVNVTCIWTEMPKYRSLDSMEIEWDYAAYYEYAKDKFSEVSVEHFWDEKTIKIKSSKNKTTTEKHKRVKMNSMVDPKTLRNNQYCIREKGIMVALELHYDRTYSDMDGGFYEVDVFRENEGVTCQFYVKPYEDTVNFYIYYNHLKTNYRVLGVVLSSLGGKIGIASGIYELAKGGNENFSVTRSGNALKAVFVCK